MRTKSEDTEVTKRNDVRKLSISENTKESKNVITGHEGRSITGKIIPVDAPLQQDNTAKQDARLGLANMERKEMKDKN